MKEDVEAQHSISVIAKCAGHRKPGDDSTIGQALENAGDGREDRGGPCSAVDPHLHAGNRARPSGLLSFRDQLRRATKHGAYDLVTFLVQILCLLIYDRCVQHKSARVIVWRSQDVP